MECIGLSVEDWKDEKKTVFQFHSLVDLRRVSAE